MSVSKFFIILCSVLFIASDATARTSPSKKKPSENPSNTQQPSAKQLKMLKELDTLVNCFEQEYGLKSWKQNEFKWSMTNEHEKAKKCILAHEKISTKAFRAILRDFCNSVKDYHVGILFYSTERASLPFDIVEAEGSYFAKSLDGSKKLIEIIAFDGTPIPEAVEQMRNRHHNHDQPETDYRIALQDLTYRSGFSGDTVPHGKVEVTQLVNNKQVNRVYEWHHVKEYLHHSLLPYPVVTHGVSKRGFQSPVAERYAATSLFSDQDYSFPNLGRVVPFGFFGPSKAYFDTKIFEFEDSGEKIGYIRIPHYAGNKEDVDRFKEMIAYLEKKTDALVIDQNNNPGGTVYYMMALLTSLSDKPLTFINDAVALTNDEGLNALLELGDLQDKNILSYLGEFTAGYPATNAHVAELIRYYKHLYEEYAQEKEVSTPYPLFGVKALAVDPKVRYTKPIVCVVNELCFSCGDFLPAILQDNKRALIFGNATAGAGGTVKGVSYPNQYGVLKLTLTASMTSRPNGQPMENRGVTPDIVYKPTRDDLLNGYQGYKEAVIKAVKQAMEEHNAQ